MVDESFEDFKIQLKTFIVIKKHKKIVQNVYFFDKSLVFNIDQVEEKAYLYFIIIIEQIRDAKDEFSEIYHLVVVLIKSFEYMSALFYATYM
jgi:hypothetical protein